MDYYQGIVTEYLRANRATFVNTEFCLQLAEGNVDQTGKHWYVDALAVELREHPEPPEVFLCEITYAKHPTSLIARLGKWQEHWQAIRSALKRDAHIPLESTVRPWLFVPEAYVKTLTPKLSLFAPWDNLPVPRITTLEMTQPWRYRSWNREGEEEKPSVIPVEMRK